MKKFITIILGGLSICSFAKAQFNNIELANNKSGINLTNSGINELNNQHGLEVISDYLKISSNAPGNENTDYLKKSRNQKTAGWCLLGAGAVGLVVGLASFPKDGDLFFGSDADNAKADRATIITIIGSALMLGSTPFFIFSKVNKKRATVSANNQKTGFGVPSYVSKSITGVTLSIAIGK